MRILLVAMAVAGLALLGAYSAAAVGVSCGGAAGAALAVDPDALPPVSVEPSVPSCTVDPDVDGVDPITVPPA